MNLAEISKKLGFPYDITENENGEPLVRIHLPDTYFDGHPFTLLLQEAEDGNLRFFDGGDLFTHAAEAGVKSKKFIVALSQIATTNGLAFGKQGELFAICEPELSKLTVTRFLKAFEWTDYLLATEDFNPEASRAVSHRVIMELCEDEARHFCELMRRREQLMMKVFNNIIDDKKPTRSQTVNLHMLDSTILSYLVNGKPRIIEIEEE